MHGFYLTYKPSEIRTNSYLVLEIQAQMSYARGLLSYRIIALFYISPAAMLKVPCASAAWFQTRLMTRSK